MNTSILLFDCILLIIIFQGYKTIKNINVCLPSPLSTVVFSNNQSCPDCSNDNYQEIKSFAIAYTITPGYLHKIMVSIFSIAQVKKSDPLINIYIFYLGDMNFSPSEQDEFNKVKQLSNKINVNIVQINQSYIENWFEMRRMTLKPVFFIRLLLAELLKEDLVIYLDSEIIAGNDFYPYILTYLKTPHTIYGVEDLGVQKHRWVRDMLRNQRMDTYFYINAGIFFFKNGAKAKLHFKEAIKTANTRRLSLTDQDSLNILGPNVIGLVPYTFNCRTLLIKEREHCIFHHDTVNSNNLIWQKVEQEFFNKMRNP